MSKDDHKHCSECNDPMTGTIEYGDSVRPSCGFIIITAFMLSRCFYHKLSTSWLKTLNLSTYNTRPFAHLPLSISPPHPLFLMVSSYCCTILNSASSQHLYIRNGKCWGGLLIEYPRFKVERTTVWGVEIDSLKYRGWEVVVERVKVYGRDIEGSERANIWSAKGETTNRSIPWDGPAQPPYITA